MEDLGHAHLKKDCFVTRFLPTRPIPPRKRAASPDLRPPATPEHPRASAFGRTKPTVRPGTWDVAVVRRPPGRPSQ